MLMNFTEFDNVFCENCGLVLLTIYIFWFTRKQICQYLFIIHRKQKYRNSVMIKFPAQVIVSFVKTQPLILHIITKIYNILPHYRAISIYRDIIPKEKTKNFKRSSSKHYGSYQQNKPRISRLLSAYSGCRSNGCLKFFFVLIDSYKCIISAAQSTTRTLSPNKIKSAKNRWFYFIFLGHIR